MVPKSAAPFMLGLAELMELGVDLVELPAQRAVLVRSELLRPGRLGPAPTKVIDRLRLPLLPVHANQRRPTADVNNMRPIVRAERVNGNAGLSKCCPASVHARCLTSLPPKGIPKHSR
jgi:hypothetical protein